MRYVRQPFTGIEGKERDGASLFVYEHPADHGAVRVCDEAGGVRTWPARDSFLISGMGGHTGLEGAEML